jgi:hypothetical protein
MRLFIVSVAFAGIAAAAWGTSRNANLRATPSESCGTEFCGTGAGTPAAGDGLIVHEWGTFTSFSGSDGVRLEFRPLVDEDLPPFVLDRFLQSGMVPLFTKSEVRVRMRMETPITYFYTDRERDVNVRVGFPEGLLTEFYPPVAQMQPPFNFGERLPITQSSLDWGSIHLIPIARLQARVDDPQRRRLLESLLPAGLVPLSDAKFHYGHARETDSALVHVHRAVPDGDPRSLVPSGDFFEKFLFYRGVGNFDLPLALCASSDGKFELVNSGSEPIRSLFLIDVDGPTVHFAAYDEIAAGERLHLVGGGEPATIEALAEAVATALVAEGLYEKEAFAMVKTWRSSWFGETGTRLLYVVPPSITEALLPLAISPQPEETVRVLVGRMEIMTPELEAQVAAVVQQSAANRQAACELARSEGREPDYAGPADLAGLGRLAEPALTRIRMISKDPAIRAEAKLLIERHR